MFRLWSEVHLSILLHWLLLKAHLVHYYVVNGHNGNVNVLYMYASSWNFTKFPKYFLSDAVMAVVGEFFFFWSILWDT